MTLTSGFREVGCPIIDALAAAGPKALTAIRSARAEVRSRVWKLAGTRSPAADGSVTSVKFAGCSVDNGKFTYAGLQLKKARAGLPDTVVNRDDNYCDTSSFGDKAKGTYYFNHSNLNGRDSVSAYLSVSTVTVRY